jgi:hypothetical protein
VPEDVLRRDVLTALHDLVVRELPDPPYDAPR